MCDQGKPPKTFSQIPPGLPGPAVKRLSMPWGRLRAGEDSALSIFLEDPLLPPHCPLAIHSWKFPEPYFFLVMSPQFQSLESP